MNRTLSPLPAALLLAGALTVLPAMAEQREHGAHVHGSGKLNVVIEAHELHIELESPAANLVGFEHTPRNAEQKRALNLAIARLKDAAALFELPPDAACHLEASVLDSTLLENKVETQHEGHKHHATHVEENHRRHEGYEHHNKEAGAAHGHADILARYRFHCDSPGQLQGVTVRLFEQFPATEKLAVQYLTPAGQGAAELTAGEPRLLF